VTDQPPDHLCVDPKSPFYDEAALTRGIGIRFKGHERPSDRRSIEVSLTPRGSDMLAQILPTVLAQTDLALDGFTPEEVDRLREQLGRIVANLKR